MFRPGDICELKDGVKQTVQSDGDHIRIFPFRFIVGIFDIHKGKMLGHVSGLKVEISGSPLSKFYDVVGSVGTFHREEVDERLDAVRLKWIEGLGDRIPTDEEVHDLISLQNETLKEVVPGNLGVYSLRFTGIYLDGMKRNPFTRMEWIPPTMTAVIERSQTDGNDTNQADPSNHDRTGHEAVGNPEAG